MCVCNTMALAFVLWAPVPECLPTPRNRAAAAGSVIVALVSTNKGSGPYAVNRDRVNFYTVVDRLCWQFETNHLSMN